MANKKQRQFLEKQIQIIKDRKAAGHPQFGDPRLLKDYTMMLNSLK